MRCNNPEDHNSNNTCDKDLKTDTSICRRRDVKMMIIWFIIGTNFVVIYIVGKLHQYSQRETFQLYLVHCIGLWEVLVRIGCTMALLHFYITKFDLRSYIFNRLHVGMYDPCFYCRIVMCLCTHFFRSRCVRKIMRHNILPDALSPDGDLLVGDITYKPQIVAFGKS